MNFDHVDQILLNFTKNLKYNFLRFYGPKLIIQVPARHRANTSCFRDLYGFSQIRIYFISVFLSVTGHL